MGTTGNEDQFCYVAVSSSWCKPGTLVEIFNILDLDLGWLTWMNAGQLARGSKRTCHARKEAPLVAADKGAQVVRRFAIVQKPAVSTSVPGIPQRTGTEMSSE